MPMRKNSEKPSLQRRNHTGSFSELDEALQSIRDINREIEKMAARKDQPKEKMQERTLGQFLIRKDK
jgi:hypothetical protein